MSFALEVKEEIISHTFSIEQRKSLLNGFVRNNAEMIFSNGKEKLKLVTISNRIARSLLSFCKEFFVGEIEISVIQSQILKKQKTFQITLIGNLNIFLKEIGIYDENFEKQKFSFNNFKKQSSLLRAYIAGIFIATGSVNSPETTNYHLEVQFKDKAAAIDFVTITDLFNFEFKILERKNNRYVCYIKKSLMVSDFIKLIDASQAVMAFENQRISRDVYNNINRMNNIDISNQTKALAASQKQIEQIEHIKTQKMFHLLSKKAQILAKLRLENPEAPFSELEYIMNSHGTPITKSGVSNLFKTIKKISEEV
ncbi:DNA-binding protein WhiA [Mesoplasma syrphidae]|uniref:Probable cell division protein WhiA n=1 Tax=Mesoplasma syrphidae TaxID=225999 RepID=A0A2K9BP70_9MOLU|nr:DNA-binding protein WhiA [Mesoplasma syrphidae]AUF83833.1 DNA-binding protein WhiA [Mesoplasma syrphidae]